MTKTSSLQRGTPWHLDHVIDESTTKADVKEAASTEKHLESDVAKNPNFSLPRPQIFLRPGIVFFSLFNLYPPSNFFISLLYSMESYSPWGSCFENISIFSVSVLFSLFCC